MFGGINCQNEFKYPKESYRWKLNMYYLIMVRDTQIQELSSEQGAATYTTALL